MPVVGGSEEAVRLGLVIRAARDGKLWSQMILIRYLREAASELSPDRELPSNASLKSMLSRWERGHKVPEPHYRILLCRILDLKPDDLLIADGEN